MRQRMYAFFNIILLLILLIVVLLSVGACVPASEPKPFPPPEGYSSWDAL